MTNCQQPTMKDIPTNSENGYDSFGAKISVNKAITSKELLSKLDLITAGDTINVKLTSKEKKYVQKKDVG